jgi:hypothetical protein
MINQALSPATAPAPRLTTCQACRVQRACELITAIDGGPVAVADHLGIPVHKRLPARAMAEAVQVIDGLFAVIDELSGNGL